MSWKYNPFTDALDKVGSGGGTSYIDGDVEYHSNLPVTVGTPAVNSAFLVRKGEGLYFISRKPAGIWVRELNNGNLDDWKYAGTFSDLYRDANFRILNNADVSKELAFDVSGVTTGTTRTLTVPNASGTLGWLQSVSSITVSTDHQLTAARNQRVRVNSTSSGSGASVYLPSTGNAEGDRLEVACVGLTGGTLSVRTGQYDFTVSASMGLNEQRTFIYTAGAWTVGTVESHTHAGLGPTFASSAFQVTEPSGIVTNRLAFSLSGLTAGATRTLTVPNASGRIQVEGQPIGDTTPAAGSFTTLAANNGILNASAPVLNLSQTWNNSGVTFTGLRFNITNTNSGALSLFADFQVGGTTQFSVRRDGVVACANRINMASAVNGLEVSQASNGASPVRYTVDSGGTGNGQMRPSGNVMEQLGTTTTAGQTFRLYNTFTDASNHERGFMRWSSNVLQIGTEKAGTGSARDMQLVVDGTTRFTVASNGTASINAVTTIQNANNLLINGGSLRFQASNGIDPVHLERDASDILALRRTTNGQTFRLYNTVSGTNNVNFDRVNFRWASNEFIIDAEAGGTGTLRGIKIGSATSSLLGFYGVTPVDQPATVTDPTGGGTQDAEARTAINAIIDRLQELGLIA